MIKRWRLLLGAILLSIFCLVALQASMASWVARCWVKDASGNSYNVDSIAWVQYNDIVIAQCSDCSYLQSPPLDGSYKLRCEVPGQDYSHWDCSGWCDWVQPDAWKGVGWWDSNREFLSNKVYHYYDVNHPTPTPTPTATPIPTLTPTPFTIPLQISPVPSDSFESSGFLTDSVASDSFESSSFLTDSAASDSFESSSFLTDSPGVEILPLPTFITNAPDQPGILGTPVAITLGVTPQPGESFQAAMAPPPPVPSPIPTATLISATPVPTDSFTPWTSTTGLRYVGRCAGSQVRGPCLSSCSFDAAGYLHLSLMSHSPLTSTGSGTFLNDFFWGDPHNQVDGPSWAVNGTYAGFSAGWEDKGTGKIGDVHFPYTYSHSLPFTFTVCSKRSGPVWDGEGTDPVLWIPGRGGAERPCDVSGPTWWNTADYLCQNYYCSEETDHFSAVQVWAANGGPGELHCNASSGYQECSWDVWAFISERSRDATCWITQSLSLRDNYGLWADRYDSYDVMPGGLTFRGYGGADVLGGGGSLLFNYNLADPGSHYYSGTVDSVDFYYGFEQAELEQNTIDLRLASDGLLTRTLPYTGTDIFNPRIIDGDCYVLIPEVDRPLGAGLYFPGAEFCIKYVDPGLDLPFIPEALLYNAIAGVVALTIWRLLRGR